LFRPALVDEELRERAAAARIELRLVDRGAQAALRVLDEAELRLDPADAAILERRLGEVALQVAVQLELAVEVALLGTDPRAPALAGLLVLAADLAVQVGLLLRDRVDPRVLARRGQQVLEEHRAHGQRRDLLGDAPLADLDLRARRLREHDDLDVLRL